MNKTTLEFPNTVTDMVLLAAFVAELVRQGIVFTLRRDNIAVQITITGGY
ncbi:MAG: hypothetical protein WC822_01385 [Candidatus Paceibacterota bacterium]|jgi:hypothetical protein